MRRGQATLEALLVTLLFALGFAGLGVLLRDGEIASARYQRAVLAQGLP